MTLTTRTLPEAQHDRGYPRGDRVWSMQPRTTEGDCLGSDRRITCNDHRKMADETRERLSARVGIDRRPAQAQSRLEHRRQRRRQRHRPARGRARTARNVRARRRQRSFRARRRRQRHPERPAGHWRHHAARRPAAERLMSSSSETSASSCTSAARPDRYASAIQTASGPRFPRLSMVPNRSPVPRRRTFHQGRGAAEDQGSQYVQRARRIQQ